jgi:uncharacterized SAM-binding protein YcdF (DUF218 family)
MKKNRRIFAPPPPRFSSFVLMALGTAASLWLCGLLIFVAVIDAQTEPAVTEKLSPTDAIVVLTGGSERLTTGLELLQAGKAQKLFVSGVHPGLTLDHLLGNQTMPANLRQCCVVLGHAAESTLGNADETQTWMDLENYHSLRLVTANYHMPRSLLIFRKTMPDLVIAPHPVSPDSVKLKGWWQHSGTASLLVTEYNKYLVALVRLKWSGL